MAYASSLRHRTRSADRRAPCAPSCGDRPLGGQERGSDRVVALVRGRGRALGPRRRRARLPARSLPAGPPARSVEDPPPPRRNLTEAGPRSGRLLHGRTDDPGTRVNGMKRVAGMVVAVGMALTAAMPASAQESGVGAA